MVKGNKHTEIEYYRDNNGKWWVMINGQCNLPVKQETSELMEISFLAGCKQAPKNIKGVGYGSK